MKKYLRSALFLILIISVTTAIGVFYIIKAGRDTDNAMREALISKVKLVTASMAPEEFRVLAGNADDKKSEYYKSLKKKFIAICESQEEVRYTYIIGMRNDKLFFYMDSEKKKYTNPQIPLAEPGEIYDDAPEEFVKSLKEGKSVTFGPYTDKWGTFVSASTPFCDENGKTLCIVGADVTADNWRWLVFMSRLEFTAFTILINGLIIVFYVIYMRKRAGMVAAVNKFNFQNEVLNIAKSDNSEYYPALKRAAETVARAANVDSVSVWRYNSEATELVCDELFSLSENAHSKRDKIVIAEWPVYFKLVQEQRTLVLNDVETDGNFDAATKRYFEKYKISSMLDNLIWLHGRPVGVICLEHSGEKRQWTSEEKDFAVAVADMISLVIEATERKKAEEVINRLGIAIEQSIDGVAVADLGGFIIFVNSAWVKMHGFTSSEEITGRNLSIFHSEEQMRKDVVPFNELVMKYGSHEGEVGHIKTDGTKFPTIMTTTLMRNENGEPVGMVAIARDITERKKAEEELFKSSKHESLGILAGGIAHDFNNYLMGIIGNVTLVKKRVAGDEKTSGILERVEKIVQKAKNLTEQLIMFSKGGAPVKNIASMNDLIKLSAQFALTGTNITLTFGLDEKLWVAEIDEGQITQVITNIVINAKQAMNESGAIVIKTENVNAGEGERLPLTPGTYVKISIVDNGLGIQQDNIKKIFDPYFTTKPAGSGLGLSTSYSIVKNHGGMIAVESSPGRGTAFYIYIPAQPFSTPAKPESLVFEPACGKRILVMDDDETVLIPLCEILKEAGNMVEKAQRGEEVIDLYVKYKELGMPFDVVVMDLVITGGMGGRDTMERLLMIDPNVRAIVSSGYSNDPIMSNYKKYGFCGVLTKPYQNDEMNKLINEIAGK